MINGYLGDDDTFDRVIAAFSDTYADRSEHVLVELTADVDADLIDVVRDI